MSKSEDNWDRRKHEDFIPGHQQRGISSSEIGEKEQKMYKGQTHNEEGQNKHTGRWLI